MNPPLSRLELCTLLFCFGGIAFAAGGLTLIPYEKKTRPPMSSLTPLPTANQFPTEKLLSALREVESSGIASAVSSAGAMGLYQIMPGTWRQHSERPLAEAFNPVLNREIAVKHLLWLKKTLRVWITDREPTLIDVLCSWHGGIGRYRERGYDLNRMPESTQVFVERMLDRFGG